MWPLNRYLHLRDVQKSEHIREVKTESNGFSVAEFLRRREDWPTLKDGRDRTLPSTGAAHIARPIAESRYDVLYARRHSMTPRRGFPRFCAANSPRGPPHYSARPVLRKLLFAQAKTPVQCC